MILTLLPWIDSNAEKSALALDTVTCSSAVWLRVTRGLVIAVKLSSLHNRPKELGERSDANSTSGAGGASDSDLLLILREGWQGQVQHASDARRAAYLRKVLP